jgi:cobalt-zinc-cadmium efflux system protein
VTSGFPVLSAHVLVAPTEDCHARRTDIEQMIHRDFGITHVTLQIDHRPTVVTLPRPVTTRPPPPTARPGGHGCQ